MGDGVPVDKWGMEYLLINGDGVSVDKWGMEYLLINGGWSIC